jgi:hypothetical protein
MPTPETELRRLRADRRREAARDDPFKSPAWMKALKFHEASAAAYLGVRAIAHTVAERKVMKFLFRDSREQLRAATREWARTRNGKDPLAEGRAVVSGRRSSSHLKRLP